MAEREFPIDFARFEPDPRPRRFLVLPEGFQAEAEADAQSPHFDAPPEQALEAFIEAALAEPRTEQLRRQDGQVELMQKTPVLRFRDFITAEARQDDGGSVFAVYSRAAVGYWDLGVNKKRVERWLHETKKRLENQAVGNAK